MLAVPDSLGGIPGVEAEAVNIHRHAAVRAVWLERDDADPPGDLPPLPKSWPDRYRRLAAGHATDIPSYRAAVGQVTQLWLTMFPRE
ncbi:MAG TPA: hypothetical protein VFW65_04560 [Pseudonocardiaceae bacterium]|nr:hypothetical protein [Pseudonocardiaceae bacterium]